MKTITPTSLISEIVAENYKTAPIFKAHKIDFCCNGNRSIESVCKEKGISAQELIFALQNSISLLQHDQDYQSWDIGFLAAYIFQNHHKYVEKQIPIIKEYLTKISAVHGIEHPELRRVKKLFFGSADDLTTHMKKEELRLFPAIKKLSKAVENNESISPTQLTSISDLISEMHYEHDNEGARFREIAELTNDYTLPEDGCNTYSVTLKLLQEFEEDLHKHIHLENNILFIKAMEMEQNMENSIA